MTITWEQILAFLCEDQSMAITSLLFLAFFAAVALINYALPRVLRPYFLLMFCFVLVVLLSLSIAISQLADKCKRLTQANAILEKRVRDLEEKQ